MKFFQAKFNISSKILFAGLLCSATLLTAPLKAAPAIPLQEIKTEIQNYDFVLVDGFLGDMTKKNFIETRQEIWKASPRSATVIIRPASQKTLNRNADELAQSLKNLKKIKTLNRPLLIYGHSRGSLEILTMLLRQPGLVEELDIAQVVLIQGAIQGTQLADITHAQWVKLCEKNRFTKDSKFCEFSDDFMASVRNLKVANTQRHLRQLLAKLSAKQLEILDRKVSYVTSTGKMKQTHKALLPSMIYLRMKAGHNDGIIPTKYQSWGALGKVLLRENSDHLSLLTINKFSPKKEYSFFERVFQELMNQNRLQ